MSEARFDRIEQRLDRIEGEAVAMRGEMRALNNETRQEMRALNERTGQEMRVLHEEVIGRIAALAPDFAPIRREFQKADAELREEMDRRIQPLEVLAREEARRDGDS